MTYCEGCDQDAEGVRIYRARFSGDPVWEEVRYCPDCFDLATVNWNGETDAISEYESDRCPA